MIFDTYRNRGIVLPFLLLGLISIGGENFALAQGRSNAPYPRSDQGDRSERASGMIGSFRGIDPTNRQPVSLDIAPDGDVSVVYADGRRLNGRFDGNSVRFRGQGSPW